MDGGSFYAEAIFWPCQNSPSKVYMDVHFWRYFRFAQRPFTLSLFSRFSDIFRSFVVFFTAESLSLWEKCGSIKTVHPCTVLMPSFVNKTRYCFVYPALHGGCFYSIQKSAPALWENLLFRCYLSRFFFMLMPWFRIGLGFLRPFGKLCIASLKYSYHALRWERPSQVCLPLL